LRWMIPWYTP